MTVTVIPTVIGAQGTVATGAGGFRNKRTSRDRPNYSTIEICQNNRKSPGDLRRFAFTQTPVENHQLKLV